MIQCVSHPMRLGIPESRVSAGAWGVLHGVLEKVEQGTGAPGLDFFYVFFPPYILYHTFFLRELNM